MKIDYIEFNSRDLPASKAFFGQAFGWQFNDYGPDYQELVDAGIGGGIAAAHPTEDASAPLVILRTDDLRAAVARVTDAGGQITRPIYGFPGGWRFHFREPGGTEMAVWSDAAPVQD